MTAAPTVTVRAPFAIRKRGGRKAIITPDGAPVPRPDARPPRIDNALVKALARAFRWRRMLESGDYGSIADLARAERIGRPYISQMLGLTLLAPDIVEAILDGRQGDGVTLEAAMAGAPVVWVAQAEQITPGRSNGGGAEQWQLTWGRAASRCSRRSSTGGARASPPAPAAR